MRYLIAAAVLGLAGSSFADTINVPADYATIQGAVDAAVDGDEIVVAPGTYTGTGDEVVDMKGRAITLRASGTPEETILDGQGARCVVQCSNNEGADTVIDGFTITGGSYGNGGGIYCSNSSPTISNCEISNNTASLGGGIYCGGDSSPTITDCTITGNSSSGGGAGVHISASSPTILDSIVSNSVGVGIQAADGGEPHLINCTIEASIGRGVAVSGSTVMMATDCSITGNQGRGVSASAATLTFVNCDISFNGHEYGGAGVYCSGGASFTLVNGTMSFNEAGGYFDASGGGAILCYGTGTLATLTDCILTNNSAYSGGAAMAKQYAHLQLNNCQIVKNSSIRAGGGLAAKNHASIGVVGCDISYNTDGNSGNGGGGGGVASLGAGLISISSTTITHNSLLQGSGWGGGLFCDWSHNAAPPLVTYSTICANEPNQFYGWSGPDETNYVSDVCDQDSDGIDDEIDNCDLYNPDQADCNENGIGDVCDIADGASEDINGNEIPDECDCLADVVVDGEVNINDVLVTISSWGTSGPLGDVNYDGIVDIEDLLIVIAAWGTCP